MYGIYARVSGDEQAQKGYSLGDQVSAGKVLVGNSQYREYIDDGYSGEFLERPKLDMLRNDVRSGLIDTIIMYDPDRMSRNLVNQLILADEFEKYNAKLRFITGDYDASPEGKLFFSMKGAISAYEKGKIRERTTRGKKEKVLSNKILQPNTPYGYDWDSTNKTYIINESEAKIIKHVFEQYNSRTGTLEIAKNLLLTGIKNRSGKQFSSNMIWRIVSNERYAGIAWQFVTKTTKISQYKNHQEKRPKDQQISVTIPAIISQETYAKAREIAQENKILSSRNMKHDYMLRGILFCGICGHAMLGISVQVGKYSYRYYICGKNKHSFYYNDRCESKRINANKIESLIWNEVIESSLKDEFLTQHIREEVPMDNLEVALQELSKKRKQLLIWYRSGSIEPEDMDNELKIIQQQSIAIKEKINVEKTLKTKKHPTIITPEQIKDASTCKKKNDLLLNAKVRINASRNGEEIKVDFI